MQYYCQDSPDYDLPIERPNTARLENDEQANSPETLMFPRSASFLVGSFRGDPMWREIHASGR
jgi:hypothetical protein